MQEFRRGPADTSNSATGSRVFCLRPPWVSCEVRAAVDCQLLRDAAAAAAPPDPAPFFFFYLLLLSSSLQSRQQGLRTPKVFIQPKPRGDFHQLDKRLRLCGHGVSRARTHQTFIMATPPARRGCFLLLLNGLFLCCCLFLFFSNFFFNCRGDDLFIDTSFIFKCNPTKKARLYSVG